MFFHSGYLCANNLGNMPAAISTATGASEGDAVLQGQVPVDLFVSFQQNKAEWHSVVVALCGWVVR